MRNNSPPPPAAAAALSAVLHTKVFFLKTKHTFVHATLACISWKIGAQFKHLSFFFFLLSIFFVDCAGHGTFTFNPNGWITLWRTSFFFSSLSLSARLDTLLGLFFFLSFFLWNDTITAKWKCAHVFYHLRRLCDYVTWTFKSLSKSTTRYPASFSFSFEVNERRRRRHPPKRIRCIYFLLMPSCCCCCCVVPYAFSFLFDGFVFFFSGLL